MFDNNTHWVVAVIPVEIQTSSGDAPVLTIISKTFRAVTFVLGAAFCGMDKCVVKKPAVVTVMLVTVMLVSDALAEKILLDPMGNAAER